MIIIIMLCMVMVMVMIVKNETIGDVCTGEG